MIIQRDNIINEAIKNQEKDVIWIVNYYAAPPQYATMFRHLCFAREFVKAGFDVLIISASTIHNSEVEIDTKRAKYIISNYSGIKFVHIKTNHYHGNGIDRILEMWRFPRRLLKIADKLQKPKYIIHSAFVPFDTIMNRLAKKLGAKYIVEIHDLWPASFVEFGLISKYNPLLPILYYEEHRLYQKADELVFTIEGGVDYIKDKRWNCGIFNKIELSKVHNVNQGVDLEEFDKLTSHITPDKDLDDKNKFKVIYIGSIRLANNIDVIVDAAKMILLSRPEIKFIIYGDGNQREHLEKRCLNEGIENIVFKGKVQPKDVPGILTRGNVNLFNFRTTSLIKYGLSPNKLFLYFASGKPVLSTVKPKYDLVLRYNAGISVENDSVSICSGVVALADATTEKYKTYCSGARKAAIEYSYKNLAKEMLKVCTGKY